jgi:hypothetical protein
MGALWISISSIAVFAGSILEIGVTPAIWKRVFGSMIILLYDVI